MFQDNVNFTQNLQQTQVVPVQFTHGAPPGFRYSSSFAGQPRRSLTHTNHNTLPQDAPLPTNDKEADGGNWIGTAGPNTSGTSVESVRRRKTFNLMRVLSMLLFAFLLITYIVQHSLRDRADMQTTKLNDMPDIYSLIETNYNPLLAATPNTPVGKAVALAHILRAIECDQKEDNGLCYCIEKKHDELMMDFSAETIKQTTRQMLRCVFLHPSYGTNSDNLPVLNHLTNLLFWAAIFPLSSNFINKVPRVTTGAWLYSTLISSVLLLFLVGIYSDHTQYMTVPSLVYCTLVSILTLLLYNTTDEIGSYRIAPSSPSKTGDSVTFQTRAANLYACDLVSCTTASHSWPILTCPLHFSIAKVEVRCMPIE